MSKFTEQKLEQTFAELLAEERFIHASGETITRAENDVLIESDLSDFLARQYSENGITKTEIQSIILQLRSLSSSDLYESNKTIMKMLADGFALKREDRSQKDIWVYLIDYSERDNNSYKFVTQLEIVGDEKRIPDGIAYINGIPVVVFEFKSAVREEATIFDAFNQLTVRYKRDIPELFKYNAFCVISD